MAKFLDGITIPQGAGSGKVLTSDVNGNATWQTPSGGSDYSIKTGAYTAVNGDKIVANTSGGTFTITLPATPSAGNIVTIADGADWSVTNLTVARNGSTIEGLAQDVTVDVKGISIDFVYDGTTWQIFTVAAKDSYPTGAGGDNIFFENGTTVTTSYTVTSGKNAMSAGPITINSGATVTVPSGSVWTII